MTNMTIEELQKRLSTTHDLNNLKDCQEIIASFLRVLELQSQNKEQVSRELKKLAFKVKHNLDQALDQADDILKGASLPANETMRLLEQMSTEMVRAGDLDDLALTDEVFQEVWGRLDFDGRPSAVLEEMIHRFKKLTGQSVPKDDEG